MENGGPPPDAAAGEAGTKQPGIRWERFLPRRSLRVLLVEHDDSTRHIVTALLRKCSYHVAAVADGMKAWEALREKNYHFDLVLAEVAMPSFSGIGLLSKIMGAEECKHIPVIMMSSHDSVGVVLKCMLKGAVDFLVKPVRKNELRNLWQHVWRKHCSSSSGNVSDNHAASNHFSANGSDKSQTGENSEEGNNAQSSGSMPEVDAQRDEEMEPFQVGGGGHKDEVETKPEQVEHLMTVGCNGQIRDESVGIVAKVTQTVQDSPLAGDGQKPPGSYKPLLSAEVALGPTGFKEVVNVDPGSSIQYYSVNGPSQGLNGFLEAIMSSKAHPAVVENCGSQKSSLQKDAYGISSPPHLELSLRRPQLNGCLRQDFRERNILKQSITSAFSRYGEKKVHPSTINISSDLCNKANKHTDRCTSDPSSGGIHNEQTFSLFSKEKVPSSQVNAGEALIQFPVSSDNKYGTGTLSVDPMRWDASVGCSSTGEDTAIHHPELGFMSHSIPMGAIPYHTLCTGYNTILQPVFYRETSLSPHGSTAIDVAVPISSDQSNHHGNRCTNDLACMKFHHNEESHHPYHLRQPSNMEHGEWGALSSIYLDQANQIGNCSQNVINQSGSNGSGDTIDAVISTGNVFESGNESGQNCNSKDLECDRSRRAAALIKFRLKRKDRCFEKKVRYYSRKKLAEQRPRVKGQFVRQKTVESAAATDADK